MKNTKVIQKIAFIAFLVASIVTIIGALCFVNTTWDKFYADNTGATNFCWNYLGKKTVAFSGEKEATLFYIGMWSDIQLANNLLFFTGLFGVFGCAVFAILGGYGRRRYYKSNLISGIVIGSVAIILSIICIACTAVVISDFNTCAIDFATPASEELAAFDAAKASGKDVASIIANWSPFFKVQAGKYMSSEYMSEITYGSAFIGIILPIIYIIFAGLFVANVVVKFKNTYVDVKKLRANSEVINDNDESSLNDVVSTVTEQGTN